MYISIGFGNLQIMNDDNGENILDKIIKSIIEFKQNKKYQHSEHINELIVMYQKTKNETIFDKIFRMYEPIIRNMVKSKDDININYTSELNLALYNAVLNFDVNNKTNASFYTFFLKCAKNQINVINNKLNAYRRKSNKNTLSLQVKQNTAENKDITLEEILEDTSMTDRFNNIETQMVLNKIFKVIKKDDKKAILLLMQGYTLKEIGEQLGNITAPAVFAKLRRMAKNPLIVDDLKSLLMA